MFESSSTLLANRDSLNMRTAIKDQIISGSYSDKNETIEKDTIVLYLRDQSEVIQILNRFEERLKDPTNYFFKVNKLLPWI